MLNPIKNKKLLKRGAPVKARILEMSDLAPGRDCHATKMTLEVEFRGDRYTLRDRFMVAGDEPIKVGSEIWVCVDPYDRQKAAIAWDRTREDYRARTAKRRELANGLPVPVAKVREVMVGPTPEPVAGIPREFKGTQTLEPISTVMIGAYGTEGEAPAPPPEKPWRSKPATEPAHAVSIPAASPARRRVPDPGMSRHERDLIAEHPKPSVRPLAALPDPTPIRPVVPPARPAPPADATGGDLTSRLERLASLRDSGALTEAEFAAAKAQTLSGEGALISTSSASSSS